MFVYITTEGCSYTIIGIDKAVLHIKQLIQRGVAYTVSVEEDDDCLVPYWDEDTDSHSFTAA